MPVKEFYEPCYESGRAQTWAIKHRDLEVFTLAGLWETFKDAFGDTISSFTLLTIYSGRPQNYGSNARTN